MRGRSMYQDIPSVPERDCRDKRRLLWVYEPGGARLVSIRL